MKHLLILILVSLTLPLSSCRKEQSVKPAISPDPAAAVAPQAASLVTGHAPDVAARLLVEWLATTPADDREFVMDFTREVYRLYTMPPYSDSLEIFASTLERAKDSLSLAEQVNVFVAVSSPANLGLMLRNDPQADTISALIIDRYGTDSASTTTFLNALNQ